MKKNQHYIPVFYQKLFSENKNSIGKYIVDKKIYVENASIKKNCTIDYYYGKNEVIENEFMELESVASDLIYRIIDRQSIHCLEPEEYEILLIFIITLESRVQKIGNIENERFKTFYREIAKMNSYHHKIKIDEDIIDKIEVNYDIPTLTSIQSALGAYQNLKDLSSSLIISDVNRFFVTSDNPVLRYNTLFNYRNYNNGVFGIGHIGFQLLLPITNKICIYIYDKVIYNFIPAKDGNFHIRKANDIDKLNLLFYMNSYNFLLSSSATSRQYIEKLSYGNGNLKTKDSSLAVMGNNSNKLIVYQNIGVSKYINIDIFKINKHFKNMNFPLHAAGPLRPTIDTNTL